jgi:antitoxin CptB
MAETEEARLKRLAMRSWRRGTKEMDLVLGPWSEAHLEGMGEEALVLYDALLEEGDQDLIQWVMGTTAPPERFAALIGEIAGFARKRLVQR